MKNIARLGFASLLALCIAGLSHTASAANIQMLPPTACPGPAGTGGVLSWDGVSPLSCVKGFSGDASGNLTLNQNANITLNGGNVAGASTATFSSYARVGDANALACPGTGSSNLLGALSFHANSFWGCTSSGWTSVMAAAAVQCTGGNVVSGVCTCPSGTPTGGVCPSSNPTGNTSCNVGAGDGSISTYSSGDSFCSGGVSYTCDNGSLDQGGNACSSGGGPTSPTSPTSPSTCDTAAHYAAGTAPCTCAKEYSMTPFGCQVDLNCAPGGIGGCSECNPGDGACPAASACTAAQTALGEVPSGGSCACPTGTAMVCGFHDPADGGGLGVDPTKSAGCYSSIPAFDFGWCSTGATSGSVSIARR
jgi:hypothetical protein